MGVLLQVVGARTRVRFKSKAELNNTRISRKALKI